MAPSDIKNSTYVPLTNTSAFTQATRVAFKGKSSTFWKKAHAKPSECIILKNVSA